ncbi:hypothetical protein AA13595_2842 [Gluconacetobacter johannae DSM 13595]|uniref:hypothetical protein n=1 Tax=Gluconacetobacter johannae TaxID=112140 RepID=UPI001FE389A2|nr:hypothetical protein [Gluconacetobacter johannae]GBQ90203.1 hypothetical protein AA13595_2842 [Gluconacetobacter johannae DSM 13595]
MTATDPPDPATLMRDWMAIWQSEAAALRLDREMADAARRMTDLWAAGFAAAARATPSATQGATQDAPPAGTDHGTQDGDHIATAASPDLPPGRAGADAAPGAAPAGDASALRADIAALGRQLDRIERRLARLESRIGDAPPSAGD